MPCSRCSPPPEPINVTQLLIRPFLVRAGLAALLVLPLVTARTRTFSRTVKTYLLMLMAPAVLCAALFAFGAPEWGPLAGGFLGLLLIGIAFIAVGLLVSSLSTSAVAAAVATLALSTALVAFRDVFIGGVLDDFAKGVIDIGDIISGLLVVALALFLARQTLRRAQADGGNRFHAGVQQWLNLVEKNNDTVEDATGTLPGGQPASRLALALRVELELDIKGDWA